MHFDSVGFQSQLLPMASLYNWPAFVLELVLIHLLTHFVLKQVYQLSNGETL